MRNVLGVLAAAAGILVASQPILGQQQQEPLATVEVQNNFETPVDVFVESGRFDRRIGSVEALSTAELPLPDWYVGRGEPIQLFVSRAGVDRETQWFEVDPGDMIGMVVPPREPQTQTMSADLPEELLSETTLTVENRRSSEVEIYAEEGIFSVRIGKVAPNSTETLEFPESVVTPFNTVTVLVDPRTGEEMESHPLQLEAGEHLGLELEPR
jgi:hypothetical protein